MASGKAVAIALAYEDTQPVAKFQLSAIDKELQEVREVLMLTRKNKDANGIPCWCEVMMRTLPHMEDCQRGRALWATLEIK